MRRDPPDEGGFRIERTPYVVRIVGDPSCIVYSRLTDDDAPRVVHEEAAYFRSLGLEVEWKVYAHDPPPALPRILLEAGFSAEAPETLMVSDLAESATIDPSAPMATVRRIRSRDDLELAAAVSEKAFGAGEGWSTETYAGRLGDPSLALFAAYVDGVPAACGRLELPPGRRFASLWGGATHPQFRRRGLYRALVVARAEAARARGYRYLTVDARASSRPILETVGFRPLVPVQGWRLPRGAAEVPTASAPRRRGG